MFNEEDVRLYSTLATAIERNDGRQPSRQLAVRVMCPSEGLNEGERGGQAGYYIG